MKELSIKRYVRILFGAAMLVFILNKFHIRPWVLDHQLQGLIEIIVLSIPNFIEAIIGMFILTGLLLQLREWYKEKLGAIREVYLYSLALVIASLYTILQEFKFHNLGGRNVFDPYDVVASVIGLLMTFGILLKFGFIDKAPIANESIK